MKVVGVGIVLLLLLAIPSGSAVPCGSPGGCEFWDEFYHEYVVYDVDVTEFDVLIVPGAASDGLRHVASARRAVQIWQDAIDGYGAPWLKEGLKIRPYVVGVDLVPPSALAHPDIVILLARTPKAVLFTGIGIDPIAFLPCIMDGIECGLGGPVCAAINVPELTHSDVRVQNLIAHEFGHCLGAGHVGDANDFDAKLFPAYDVMSYTNDDVRVNCASNLNVRLLEGLYGRHLGQSSWVRRGHYIAMDPAEYQRLECTLAPDPGLPV